MEKGAWILLASGRGCGGAGGEANYKYIMQIKASKFPRTPTIWSVFLNIKREMKSIIFSPRSSASSSVPAFNPFLGVGQGMNSLLRPIPRKGLNAEGTEDLAEDSGE
jgi:hypothetical protein